MKKILIAMLVCLAGSTSASAIDLYCPLFEIYPYPPNYVYWMDLYSPDSDCENAEPPTSTYGIGNYSVVPYIVCEDCDNGFRPKKDKPVQAARPAEGEQNGDGEKQGRRDGPKRKQAIGLPFGGIPFCLNMESPYDLPPGPDRSGPGGKPDGEGDARQYSKVSDEIDGERRIVELRTPQGRNVFAKVFEVKMDLEGRKKMLAFDPNRESVKVSYIALQLVDKEGGYEPNATLPTIAPADRQRPCYMFSGTCRVGKREPMPIVVLLEATPGRP